MNGTGSCYWRWTRGSATAAGEEVGGGELKDEGTR
jgi:hypothetical protein